MDPIASICVCGKVPYTGPPRGDSNLCSRRVQTSTTAQAALEGVRGGIRMLTVEYQLPEIEELQRAASLAGHLQVNPRVEVLVTHAAPHRHIGPPLGWIVAGEV